MLFWLWSSYFKFYYIIFYTYIINLSSLISTVRIRVGYCAGLRSRIILSMMHLIYPSTRMNFRLYQKKSFLRTFIHKENVQRDELSFVLENSIDTSNDDNENYLTLPNSIHLTFIRFSNIFEYSNNLGIWIYYEYSTLIHTRLIPAVWIWPCSLWVSTCWTSRRRIAHGWTWTWSCSRPSLWFRYRWAHLSTVSFSLAKSTVTNMEQWWKSHSEFSYLNDWYNIKIFHIIQWS